MSPEQVKGAENADVRSDIFSLGSILYAMVTGRDPFEGASDFEVMQAVVQGRYVPPSQFSPHLTKGVKTSIERSLSVDPMARFHSTQEFIEILKSPDRDIATHELNEPPQNSDLTKQLDRPRWMHLMSGSIAIGAVGMTDLLCIFVGTKSPDFPANGMEALGWAWLVGTCSMGLMIFSTSMFVRDWVSENIDARWNWLHPAGLSIIPIHIIWLSCLDKGESGLGTILAILIPVFTLGWMIFYLKKRRSLHPGRFLAALAFLWSLIVVPLSSDLGNSALCVTAFACWALGTSLISESAVLGFLEPGTGKIGLPPLGPTWKALKVQVGIGAVAAALLGIAAGVISSLQST
jgi:hypothetical protein